MVLLLVNSYLHLNASNIRWKLFKTGRTTFTYKKAVKIYIAYEKFVAIYCGKRFCFRKLFVWSCKVN